MADPLAILDLCLNIMDRLQAAARAVEFSKKQCIRAATRVAEYKHRLVEWRRHRLGDPGSDLLQRMHALQRLEATLREGILLIETFGKQRYLIRLLHRDVNAEGFETFHQNLDECIRDITLDVVMEAAAAGRAHEAERGLREQCAREDRQELKQQMLELKEKLLSEAGHRRSEQDRNQEKLAQEIVNRLDARASEPGQDLAVLQLKRQDVQYEGCLVLGHGGFGIVYRGRYLNDEWVAVKAVECNRPAAQGKVIRALMEEARLCFKARHSRVVQLLGVCTDESPYLLVMECLAGTLEKLMRRRPSPPFSVAESVGILLQIAEGVQFLHRQDIAHRDLKPANILVEDLDAEHIKIKLCDFGLAKVKRETSLATSKVGTGCYRAPECQSDAAGRYQARAADIYSFGVTTYEVLTGEWPADLVTQLGRAAAIAKMVETVRSACGAELANLVSDCCQHEPNLRPANFGFVCTRLKLARDSLLDPVGLARRLQDSVHIGEAVEADSLASPSGVASETSRSGGASSAHADQVGNLSQPPSYKTPAASPRSTLQPAISSREERERAAFETWRKTVGSDGEATWERFWELFEGDLHIWDDEERARFQDQVCRSPVAPTIKRAEWVRAVGSSASAIDFWKSAKQRRWSPAGLARGQTDGQWTHKVEAPAGAFIVQWKGKTGSGQWLDLLGIADAGAGKTLPEQPDGFARVTGRAGGWLTNFMGVGAVRDSPWEDSGERAGLTPSSRVVGYQMRVTGSYAETVRFLFAEPVRTV
ncbi:Putative serine/threonine-protein kinase [Klebsormidium nitens]|uniref:Putative serine/threonine-protein kinase n=1 Tax=Klebsormidium nitens TaxID=105231 RepID=A0A1Y1IFM8_KLENI|nr:Putative serine/threonine-protein kinase [Klebsormidium nitens]|eukprot:GAQ87566.1 Putative serine/threonine-protein kinase [Klebsormidium nitens]